MATPYKKQIQVLYFRNILNKSLDFKCLIFDELYLSMNCFYETLI